MFPRDTLMRIVVIALLIYSLVSLAAVGRELRQLEERETTLKAELEELETENEQFRRELVEGKSDEEMMQLARARLGLVLPGEKVFYFTTDREG